jgi:hypothetical protein
MRNFYLESKEFQAMGNDWEHCSNSSPVCEKKYYKEAQNLNIEFEPLFVVEDYVYKFLLIYE